MGGSSAQQASPDINKNEASTALNNLNTQVNNKADPRISQLLADYGSGKISYADALAQAKGASTSAQAPSLSLQDKINLGMRAQGPGFDLAKATDPANDAMFQSLYAKEHPEQNASTGDLSQAFADAVSTNGITGSKLASEQVRSDPLTSGIFGAGGLQDQTLGRQGQLTSQVDQSRGQIQKQQDKLDAYGDVFAGDSARLDESRNALMGRDQSYGLTDQDLAAYGQAAGNINRNFAGMDQSLSQALADRGLSAGNSGVAQQSFSGQMGNKFEQLANLQSGIAQNRIASAMDLAKARSSADQARYQTNVGRYGADAGILGQNVGAYNADVNNLGNNSQLALGLGQLGQTAQANQYGRQVAGSENNYNQQAGVAGLAMNNQGLQQNVYNTQWAQQKATGFDPMKSIGDAFSSTVGKAAGAVQDKIFGVPKKEG